MFYHIRDAAKIFELLYLYGVLIILVKSGPVKQEYYVYLSKSYAIRSLLYQYTAFYALLQGHFLCAMPMSLLQSWQNGIFLFCTFLL